MPCCTYLSDTDYRAQTSDDEINSLIAQVCRETGDDWRVQETIHVQHRWFRAPRYALRYTLYCHVKGPEFQVINFYRPERKGEHLAGLNMNNEASHVAAFLYGVLAGAHSSPPEG